MFSRFSVFLFLTGAIGIAAEYKIPADYDGKVYSECGGVIDAPVGLISYKPIEAFLPNERCIWVVRVPAATGYSVSLKSAGFPFPNDERHNINDHSVFLKGFGNSMEYKTVVLKSINTTHDLFGQQLLTITFHAGSANNNSYSGFILEYTPFFCGSPTYNPAASLDVQVTSGSGIIRHPPVGNVTKYDASTFIFKPPNNIHDPGRKTKVWYTLNVGPESEGCSGNCRCLYVYYLNERMMMPRPRSPFSDRDDWENYERRMMELQLRHRHRGSHVEDRWGYPLLMCSREDSVTFEHSDIILVVFFSKAELDNANFNLVYFI